jgi:hypothetical protein
MNPKNLISFSILLAFLYLSATKMAGQAIKTVHSYYPIPDDVDTIRLHPKDNFEFVSWNGVQLMVLTTVSLENGNLQLLESLFEAKRYENQIVSNSNKGFLLEPLFQKRFAYKFNGLFCAETVKLKIYVPEMFDVKSESLLVRRPPLAAVASQEK